MWFDNSAFKINMYSVFQFKNNNITIKKNLSRLSEDAGSGTLGLRNKGKESELSKTSL